MREPCAVSDRGGDVGKVTRGDIRDADGDEITADGRGGVANQDMAVRLQVEGSGHSRGDGGAVSARVDEDTEGRCDPGGGVAVRVGIVDPKGWAVAGTGDARSGSQRRRMRDDGEVGRRLVVADKLMAAQPK